MSLAYRVIIKENDMPNSSEKFAVADFLKQAAGSKWSGKLRANRAGEQVGVVVMHDGDVAWATSSGQAEDFGSVLERVGLVPRDKLTTANLALQNNRSAGKTANLSALLMEECLISPSLLRTCFKTHVSAAIASLVETPLLSLQAEDESMSVDTSLLFNLSELLTDQEPLKVEPPEGAAKDELLTGLALLPGYRYSFIADTDGRLLAFHMADAVQIQVESIIPKALSWLYAACMISAETEMGLVMSAYLHGEAGSLFAQMTDESKRFFLAVSFSSEGKLGVIKHKISELIPAVQRFTAVL